MADLATITTASIALPAVVAALTLPALWHVAGAATSAACWSRRRRRRRPSSSAADDASPAVPGAADEVDIYEDADGKASEESMRRYSTRRTADAVLVLLVTCLACALALAIFATATTTTAHARRRALLMPAWCLFASWLLLVVQLLCTFRTADPVTRYRRAGVNAVTCIVLMALGTLFALAMHVEGLRSVVMSVLLLVQLAGTIAMVGLLVSIPRRPEVHRPDGAVVDRQYTGSIWSKWSLDWATDLLDLSATKLISADDLRAMDSRVRARDAKTGFMAIALKPELPMWIQIFWAYRRQFAFQWLLTIVSSIVDALPGLAVLRLLQYLERREAVDLTDVEAWMWVASLLLATLLETFTDSRIGWLMWGDLAIPIRVTLTSMLFEKMMKSKDVKEPPKAEAEDQEKKDGAGVKTNGHATTNGKATNGPARTSTTAVANGHARTSTTDVANGHAATGGESQTSPDDAAKKEKAGKADAKKPEAQKSVVNMFAVDTNLVGHAAAMSQYYVMFVSKFAVTVVFLLFLIGWQALLAGLIAAAVFYPVNKLLVSRYSRFQKNLMSVRDRKTALITEALSGIRQIKVAANEAQWTEKIMEIREEELVQLWKTRKNNLFMTLGSDLTPIFLTVFALATYTYLYGQLLPSTAFTALAVLMQLEGVLSWIPLLAMIGINGKVSLDRIEGYLRNEDKPQATYPSPQVVFDDATITFPSNKEVSPDRFTLRNVSIRFPNNALSVIFGPTGSGKSLLLAAMLGEVDLVEGSIGVPRAPPEDLFFDEKANAANWVIPSAIAYVAQSPWIENASIKDNILFGLPYDAARYEKVIQACALKRDLDMLEDGDLTEVGAQGITLSGGQRIRVTLSRAFYSRAGILILDDVFSALDAHVGKEIYEQALMGDLAKGRTRILVTHHVALCLPQAEYAVRLTARGTVDFAGPVSDLKSDDFERFEAKPPTDEQGSDPEQREPESEEAKKPKKLVEDEKREVGKVKKTVYLWYLAASGGFIFWSVVVFAYFVAQGLLLGKNFWIKLWTSSYEHASARLNHMHHEMLIQTQLVRPFVRERTDNGRLAYYLGGYMLLSIVASIWDVARVWLVYRGALRASKIVFRDMIHHVLRTSMRWLDVNPKGRILNRMTADSQSFDSALSSNFAATASSVLSILGIMVAAFFVSPYIIIFAVVLLAICARIGLRYIRGARSAKRLNSIQKSPMISAFSSALEGLSTIRAFSKMNMFERRMNKLIDAFTSAMWHNYLFSCWLSFRIALIGAIFSFAVAVFIITTPGVDASLGGFALAFALSYRRTVGRLLKTLASTELDMNAAERIFEYTNLEIENQQGMDDLPASWPAEGRLECEDLEVGYAEGLPSILKGLTFRAEANQRIGIVGRTGAGKSTFSLALFRFLEARKGSITIDGINIAKIRLHDLRTRLAIIPQDPVLFSGTIRSNLDPFDQFSDYQLKDVLQRVHLIPSADNSPAPEVEAGVRLPQENSNPFMSLSYPITSGGANISQGQKQLLCLARAILTRPKLLLLDEATSAVDMATDALIQRSIRDEFRNTTLLVVAHRLSTVADFDRILVMGDGRTVEWDSPRNLLLRDDGEGGAFKSMVGRSGEKALLERIILGGEGGGGKDDVAT